MNINVQVKQMIEQWHYTIFADANEPLNQNNTTEHYSHIFICL